jgi:glycosyltransferase involved in cell wall biosynthesis
MHILFYHQNYPAQFGHIARQLAARPGWRVSFVSKDGPTDVPGVRRISYKPIGGATAKTHYAARTFENFIAHSHGLVEALSREARLNPDLVVGHAGFGSTTFLRDLFACPQINYFEYFYHVTGSDMDFRPGPLPERLDQFRARARNAGLLLDLDNCDAGYCPTEWQRSLLPKAYQPKLKTIFDGVDRAIWKPGPKRPRKAGKYTFPDDVKLVTYAARGFESIRGFDQFMAFSKCLLARRKDVRFVVVGSDKVHYGGDEKKTGNQSYKDWVLAQDHYDLSKYAFLGTVPAEVLARLFQISDLHVYFTVPFVLSWSLFDAMACGATILASDTAPVRELIRHGETGLLHDFFDPAGMANQADRVLGDPASFAPLAIAAEQLISQSYSLEVCLPKLAGLFESEANA